MRNDLTAKVLDFEHVCSFFRKYLVLQSQTPLFDKNLNRVVFLLP